MVTVQAFLVIILLVSNTVFGDDEGEQSPTDKACIDKPCGPSVCQARCVASCLNTNLGSSVDQCLEQFCQDFGENTPCNNKDTECWKNCGFDNSPDDPLPPPMPDDLRLSVDESSRLNAKVISVEWPPTADTGLYLVEAFPMFGTNATENSQHILRKMTTDTIFSFERADICNVYMVRVMAVNGFGNSAPRYLVVDAWKPEMHFDENFDVRSIRREDDIVKVQIDYTPPENWGKGDVELVNSFVLAHACLGPLDDTIFLMKQPDEDGYYSPMVFINETEKTIELSFPAKIMYSKCLFSYRISALRTRCNVTTPYAKVDGIGVDFSINCLSTENAHCESSEIENNENNSTSNGGEVVIIADPEAMKELEAENTTPTPSNDEDTKEIVLAMEKDGLTDESTTAQTTSAPSEAGEIIIIANAEAIKELENEGTTTASSGDTDGDHDVTGGPNFGEMPPPVIVIIEPRDPKAPLCKLVEFDAQPHINWNSDGSEQTYVDVDLAWTEEKPVGAPTVVNFVIRYGPVMRSLVVNNQPDLVDELYTSGGSEDTVRRFTLVKLTPNTLYSIQICTSDFSSDAPLPWDTAPKYMIDLSAAYDPPSTTLSPDSTEDNSSNGTSGLDFMSAFIDALNTSFDAAIDAADQQKSKSIEDSESIDQQKIKSIDEPRGGKSSSMESNENQDQEGLGILEINLPQPPPQFVQIDVKPILITEESNWSSIRFLWFFMAMGLLIMTIFGFFLALKRSKNRRNKWKQFEPKTSNPICYTQTSLPNSEIKIPIH